MTMAVVVFRQVTVDSGIFVDTNFLGLRKTEMFMDILFCGLAKVYII